MHISFNEYIYSWVAIFDNDFLFAIFNKDSFDQKYEYTIQDNTSNNIDDTIISSLNYDVGEG
jgi:hypothetical protein